MNEQGLRLPEFGRILARNEMKNIMAGSDSNCHKCCWDHDHTICSSCNSVGTMCVPDAHTHQCAPQACGIVT